MFYTRFLTHGYTKQMQVIVNNQVQTHYTEVL